MDIKQLNYFIQIAIDESYSIRVCREDRNIRKFHLLRAFEDYLRRMVCYGAAAALIFQIISNVGMCIGITPVIGLTLPFISYGGSSILSLYAMLGLVSGVHARPEAPSHALYIQPRR